MKTKLFIVLGLLFFINYTYNAEKNNDHINTLTKLDSTTQAFLETKNNPKNNFFIEDIEPLKKHLIDQNIDLEASSKALTITIANTIVTADSVNKQKAYRNVMQTFSTLRLLIEHGIISYSLSLEDLFNAGLILNKETDRVDFSNLALTSIDGLKRLYSYERLKELNFAFNGLKRLNIPEFEEFKTLKIINFSFNPYLKERDIASLKELPNLVTAGTNITY